MAEQDDNIIPFPLTGPAVYRTPKAVAFEAISVPPKEGPIQLHLRLSNGVELVVPIDDELVYDMRTVLNAINPPME